MLPVNRGGFASDISCVPIGSLCRACGAALPPDLGWCSVCYTPVTPFASRPPLHEPGTFVGTPIAEPRTSRWRAGPTTMGPLGRIGWTLGLLLLFPWWALVVPLRSIWRRERIAADAPPTAFERFRSRHPRLGRELRVAPWAQVAILVVALAGVVIVFLAKDGVDRYLWGAPMIVVALTLSLAKWNDL
jgi:hypothetical protein